jgi:hypothetical protein
MQYHEADVGGGRAMSASEKPSQSFGKSKLVAALLAVCGGAGNIAIAIWLSLAITRAREPDWEPTNAIVFMAVLGALALTGMVAGLLVARPVKYPRVLLLTVGSIGLVVSTVVGAVGFVDSNAFFPAVFLVPGNILQLVAGTLGRSGVPIVL